MIRASSYDPQVMSRIVRDRQSFAVNVKIVPRHHQRRYRSLEGQHFHAQSTTIIHTTIRPLNTNKLTNNELVTARNNPYSSISSGLVDSQRADESKIAPTAKNQVKSSSLMSPDILQHCPQSNTVIHTTIRSSVPIHSTKNNNIVNPENNFNSVSSIADDGHQRVGRKFSLTSTRSAVTVTKIDRQRRSQSHIIDVSSIRTISAHEDRGEKKRRRRRRRRGCFGWCCCPCSCLCCVFCLFGTLLVGIALAAILVAFLIKPGPNIPTTAISGTTVTLVPTTITATMTTTVITITTIPSLSSLTSTNDTVYGIWNTTAGGDSSPSTAGSYVGNYYGGEEPQNAFDKNTNTKYTNFGYCNSSYSTYRACGQNTGLYVTPQQGATLLLAVQFCTGNDQPLRDPLTVTIEGSNQTSSALTLGSSWTLIYNGSTGLDTDPGRKTCGATELFLSNSVAYLSYRILVTSQRGFIEAVQYSEVELLG